MEGTVVRLSRTGSGIRNGAYVKCGDDWKLVASYSLDGPRDYVVEDGVTPEEVAVVTLALSAEAARTASELASGP